MDGRFVVVLVPILGCPSDPGDDSATDEFAEGDEGWEGGSVPLSQLDEPCGPLTPCIEGTYCQYDEYQGTWCGDEGTCTSPPTDCGEAGPVVCGCDGLLYPNVCEAHAASISVGPVEGCMLPDGTFPCGDLFCVIGEQYCKYTVPHGESESWYCNGLVCSEGEQGCDCVPEAPCGDPYYFPGQWCDPEEHGGVNVTCLPA